jgi:hypothetical protein
VPDSQDPAARTLPALGARDVASTVAEDGPSPLRRALLGLLIGAVAGGIAALLTPRPDRARRGALARDA